MTYSKISALAHYAPETVLTNDDLSKIVETNDEWITSRTGIKKRHISNGENTSDICIKIANKLLDKSQINPCDIDLVIVATITPDYATPSVACMVQGSIGAENAGAFDVSAACSGYIYALSTADKFIKSGLYKTVMVIAAETISKITDWSDRATCVLFGDGGGGAILTACDEPCGILSEELKAKGQDGESLVANHRQVKNPLTSPEDEDNPYVSMDGRAIFNFATRVVPSSIMNILEKENLTMEDIKYVIPHQANSRIIDIIARKVKTPIEKFYVNVNEYGNTSAGSVAIALSEMAENNLISKGDKVIVTGFGGGLTWGSLLIEI
ncbi:MAG: beta-ketoacyl-ACP synthase III [Lachnospirales bacterium]